MCGIFGYAGKDDASTRIINGLKRLEYRGYDSWGVAIKNDNGIELIKHAGKIGDVEESELSKESSNIGIGHTRWATHGGVTDTNAHPHFSTDKSFVLAQNGIVENYQELKQELIEKGYDFISQTDTEVIVRLIEEELKNIQSEQGSFKEESASVNEGLLKEAIRNAFLKLKGRNTIIILDNSSDHIIAVRNGSPLVLGLTADEVLIASDTLSFADRTNHIVLIENFQMIEYKDGDTKLFDINTDTELEMKPIDIDQADVKVEKEGYEHFMLKEIVEQRYTINEAMHYTEEELKPFLAVLRNSRRIFTVGAGTAGFAAMQISYILRTYAGLDVTELKAYEMESYRNLFTDKDVLIAVSQSGETADTIEAIEYAKEKGTKIASIVNMLGSSITRMSDYKFFSRSGPEICVASTKAFTAQISWGLLLALSLSGKHEEAKRVVSELSEKLQEYFKDNNFEDIKELAKILKNKEHLFILGKGQNYVTSLEGALKIKEITYKHFEGFPAGELKHGVIALVEEGTPVFGIISEDDNKADMLSALAEVKARGAYTIGVSNEPNDLFDYHLKTVHGGVADPIAKVIPFQLLSYFLALELGNSPDKPRNLAKSVTVK